MLARPVGFPVTTLALLAVMLAPTRSAAVSGAEPTDRTEGESRLLSGDGNPAQELEKLSEAFAGVAEAVKPSVVNIKAKVFDRDLNRKLKEFSGEEEHVPVPTTGTGSGVILDDDGHIVTNNHVVANAAAIWVTLASGARYRAQLVGADAMTDLAVIRIKAEGLRPARLGDSERVRVGHIVLAIGSPFRLGHSVSHGIISGVGRSGENIDVDIDYKNWLQTDAPINPGNSGGPLINTHGEVVGLNVAIATESGGHQGVGFAIPSNTVRRITEVLRRGEKVDRGYLGVSILPVDDDVASAYDLPESGGVLIFGIGEDSPAKRGQLRNEDIVMAVDGRKVRTLEQLQEIIAASSPGTTIDMTVWRKQAKQTVHVVVGAQPTGFTTKTTRLDFDNSRRGEDGPGNDDQTTAGVTLKGPFAELGFEAQAISADVIKKFRLKSGDSGVLVTKVNPASEAYEAGLRPECIIVQANDRVAETLDDLKKILTDSALARGVRLKYMIGESRLQTILRVR